MPCEAIVEELKKNKIDLDKLFLINACSPRGPHLKNCTHIGSPQSLTELSITLNLAMETKQFDFVLIEAASTLLVYNPEKITEQFFSHIISRMRKNVDVGLITVSKKGTSDAFIDFLEQCSDELITV